MRQRVYAFIHNTGNISCLSPNKGLQLLENLITAFCTSCERVQSWPKQIDFQYCHIGGHGKTSSDKHFPTPSLIAYDLRKQIFFVGWGWAVNAETMLSDSQISWHRFHRLVQARVRAVQWPMCYQRPMQNSYESSQHSMQSNQSPSHLLLLITEIFAFWQCQPEQQEHEIFFNEHLSPYLSSDSCYQIVVSSTT